MILAVTLALRGLDSLAVGAILTIALIGGAAFSLATGTLVRRLGRRNTVLLAALAMAVSGLLLALARHPALIGIAALLGTLSPGGQEVGPFAAIEQTAIADEPGLKPTRRYATYNLVGSLAAAVGALAVTVLRSELLLYLYSASGLGLAVIYAVTFHGRDRSPAPPRTEQSRPARRSLGVAERLSLLFGFDAVAGGFVVQSFIAYWLWLRFGVDQHTLGVLFFSTNVLSALSFLFAARLAERIGLLKTMVFTHLPSNVLLMLVPLAPSFPLAAAALLARFALSQMDVPTRQAYTMAIVPPEERARAAGLAAAARPAAAGVAPVLSGIAVQAAAFGLPFYLAGALKVAYDLVLYLTFRRVSLHDDAA